MNRLKRYSTKIIVDLILMISLNYFFLALPLRYSIVMIFLFVIVAIAIVKLNNKVELLLLISFLVALLSMFIFSGFLTPDSSNMLLGVLGTVYLITIIDFIRKNKMK